MSLVDSGWAAWLPYELTGALDSLGGGAEARRAWRRSLAAPRDADARERWERFRLVAPSRLDVPIAGDELDKAGCWALLEGLGLVEGTPPRLVSDPEAVELVLSLDDDDRRELDRIRAARDIGAIETPVDALPSLGPTFGGGAVGRNDPCPCGSGMKFKRCHGR